MRPDHSGAVAAAPKKSEPQRARSPKWPRRSESNSAAVATAASAPSSRAPTSQASGGNNTL
jgi:hypothetical protein